MSRPEALSLFGELDGLFAPELVPCTPADEVRLIPGDYTTRDQAGCEPDDDPEPDDEDEDDERADWTDRPEYRYGPDRLPSLVDVVSAISPHIVHAAIAADTDADAAQLLASRLSSSGHGDGRGYVDNDTRGAWLNDLHGTRTLAVTWATVARELRAVATAEDVAEMGEAIRASLTIDHESQADPRPWIPAYTLATMTTAEKFEHERADREHEKRSRRRREAQAPLDCAARAVQRDLEARLTGPRPGALF